MGKQSSAKAIEALEAAGSDAAVRPRDDFDGVSSPIANRAYAVAEICLLYGVFAGEPGRTKEATRDSFVTFWNLGKIESSTETRDRFSRLTERSLRRWLDKFEAGGGDAAAVKSKLGNRRGHSIIEENPMMKSFCATTVQTYPNIRAPYLLKAIIERFSDQRRLPKISAVKTWLSKYKSENAAFLHAQRDPDGARSSRMFAIGKKKLGVTRPGQIVELDGSPSDVFTLGDGGEVVRSHMLVAIDVFSGITVILFTRSESSEAIAELILKWIRLYGVPEAFRHDHGAGFLSKRIQRALSRLGIASLPTLPYAGYLKPFIERMIGTICRGFLENQPGFGGHNVVEKETIRKSNSFPQRRGARRNMAKLFNVELYLPELQDRADKWVKYDYANQKQAHRSGKSPNELFMEADARGEIKRADEKVLAILLAPSGFAVVTKKGFHIAGRLFWSEELIPHQGERLEYFLTADAGQIVVCTAGDAPRFICIAVDADAAGLDLQTIALSARAIQKKADSTKRAELRRSKREHRPELLAKQIIEGTVSRHQFEIQDRSRVTALPYRNDGVAAGADAVAALDGQPKKAASRRIERERAGDVSEQNWARFQRLRKLQELYGDRGDNSGGLDENDQIFLKVYEQSPDFRARVRMGAVA